MKVYVVRTGSSGSARRVYSSLEAAERSAADWEYVTEFEVHE